MVSFGWGIDKSVRYRLLVKGPLPSTMPSWPWRTRIWVARAMPRRLSQRQKAGSTGSHKDDLSDGGGHPEKEAELFVNGARKAGLLDCVLADKLKEMLILTA